MSVWLGSLHVLSLQSFGPLDHRKLHALPFLKAAKAASLDCRKVYEHIFSAFVRDESIVLSIVEPPHCSLFQYLYSN
jgi:hypothetical protein